MNARVFLLVLVCSVFMSVWNSDQQVMTAALAKKQRAVKADAVAAASQTGSSVETRAIPAESLAAFEAEMASTALASTLDPVDEPTAAAVIFSQSIPTFSMPLPFVLEGDHQSLLSHSNSSAEAFENFLAANNEVIVTELVDELPISAAFDSPEALDLSNVMIQAQAGIADAVEASETFAPSSEELGIVVNPPQVVVSPETVVAHSADNAEPVAPAVSNIAVLPFESTGPIIPLPKNLAGGMWTVMNQSGDSFRVTIERTATESTSEPVEKFEESFCLRTTSDGDRWCFIRSFADRQASEPTKAPRQATTEFFSPILR